MFNYYLHGPSYISASRHDLLDSLRCLNGLVCTERENDDQFYKHDSLFAIQTQDGNFAEVAFSRLEDVQFMRQVLPRLLGSVSSLPDEIESLDDFDSRFTLHHNAFYGFRFEDCSERHITDKEGYTAFRNTCLWKNTPRSLWEKRETLFERIVLCESVKNDLGKIGGTYLDQITEQLKELEEYCRKHWKKGEFSYWDVAQKSELTISPESQTTMNNDRLRQMRVFSLPDGRRECFELHIKTGNLRFHLYPEGQKVYVGYIGKHLPT